MVLRRISVFLPLSLLMMSGFVLLSGCGSSSNVDFVAKKEPWRATEEQACIASGAVRKTNFIRARSALGGPSVCGTENPYEMSAALGGRVSMKPPALLRCPMVPQVEHWLAEVVEPAARRYYGTKLSEITVAASYGCRPMNHKVGGRLSEHGYANALDVSRFTLANGEVITVKGGWNGTEREQAFLRTVHDGACNNFTTVLGPNYDRNHHDHFHVDLARHGRDGLNRICK
jgi:hypothetical protein